MAVWMNRNTATFTHMGAEGAPWIGQAPFTKEKHIFANIGDGTYFHSGLLAIRAAVAAKVTMTYKILYNDAVAMTGGQRHDGPLDPAMISRQIAAEGVKPIVVVTDEPEKYPHGTNWAPGVIATSLMPSKENCAKSKACPHSFTTRPAPRRSAAAASATNSRTPRYAR
jgi:indolepyruvate ferredoxin oxidoreductase